MPSYHTMMFRRDQMNMYLYKPILPRWVDMPLKSNDQKLINSSIQDANITGITTYIINSFEYNPCKENRNQFLERPEMNKSLYMVTQDLHTPL